jgi:hypothetical protein
MDCNSWLYKAKKQKNKSSKKKILAIWLRVYLPAHCSPNAPKPYQHYTFIAVRRMRDYRTVAEKTQRRSRKPKR